ncbi:MAG: hypothetical protein OXE99_14605, partial [Cellvibrionales bacterium]|nr:hypothetical protein [Cellvibrionales bacterium]
PRSSFEAKKQDDSLTVFENALLGTKGHPYPESNKAHYHFLYKDAGIPIDDAFTQGDRLFSLCWPYLSEIDQEPNA